MDRRKELFELFKKYGVNNCYVFSGIIDTENFYGRINVDIDSNNMIGKLRKEFSRMFPGSDVDDGCPSIEFNAFRNTEDRESRSYCVPNFIVDGKLVDSSVKSQKEQFIDMLKAYGVQNCYVSPSIDLTEKEPSGDILVDTRSDTLIEELYWLYTTPPGVHTGVDQDLGIFFRNFKPEKESGLPDIDTPNFVVEGRYC